MDKAIQDIWADLHLELKKSNTDRLFVFCFYFQPAR